eukprot:TRINITY_DN4575_c0_g1_i2.p1 TRINITY_DN4575_c0_g1~~TRINITY_DN4575_c0_g1_i2.p1  ORF type:complete len:107 (+),score=3.87 TRINITY_DN4575_c0_g1_i2:40-321(+)
MLGLMLYKKKFLKKQEIIDQLGLKTHLKNNKKIIVIVVLLLNSCPPKKKFCVCPCYLQCNLLICGAILKFKTKQSRKPQYNVCHQNHIIQKPT